MNYITGNKDTDIYLIRYLDFDSIFNYATLSKCNNKLVHETKLFMKLNYSSNYQNV